MGSYNNSTNTWWHSNKSNMKTITAIKPTGVRSETAGVIPALIDNPIRSVMDTWSYQNRSWVQCAHTFQWFSIVVGTFLLHFHQKWSENTGCGYPLMVGIDEHFCVYISCIWFHPSIHPSIICTYCIWFQFSSNFKTDSWFDKKQDIPHN